MRKTAAKIILVSLFSTGPCVAGSEVGKSPYMGQEQREIKAMSAERQVALLAGSGLGYAKAAELNGYPGPKHVIELADMLQLSPDQLAATQAIFDHMSSEAKLLGAALIAAEQALDEAFAQQTIAEDKLRVLTNKIAMLEGKLRSVHLEAHLAQVDVLTEQQLAQYPVLRGYGHSGVDHKHHH